MLVATMGRKKIKTEKSDSIRVYESVALMIEEIYLAEGVSSADLCSEILRQALRPRHAKAVATLRGRFEQREKEMRELDEEVNADAQRKRSK